MFMKDVQKVERLDQARILLHPVRVELLERLRTPKVCSELAREMSMTPQRINNHLRALRKARLIKVVKRTPKGHLIEKTYCAAAKTFWLSPQLTCLLEEDPKKLQERLSLHNLLRMSSQLQQDAADLLDASGERDLPSIGVSAEVRLRSEEERQQFTREFLRLMHGLLERYQGPAESGQSYKAMLVCYPKTAQEKDAQNAG